MRDEHGVGFAFVGCVASVLGAVQKTGLDIVGVDFKVLGCNHTINVSHIAFV